MPQLTHILESSKAEETISRESDMLLFTCARDGYPGKELRPITSRRSTTKLWRRRCWSQWRSFVSRCPFRYRPSWTIFIPCNSKISPITDS